MSRDRNRAEGREDLAKVAEGSRDAMERVAQASTAWNATLRTTCVATQIEGGHAKNALPQLAAANVELPGSARGFGQEYVQKALWKRCWRTIRYALHDFRAKSAKSRIYPCATTL